MLETCGLSGTVQYCTDCVKMPKNAALRIEAATVWGLTRQSPPFPASTVIGCRIRTLLCAETMDTTEQHLHLENGLDSLRHNRHPIWSCEGRTCVHSLLLLFFFLYFLIPPNHSCAGYLLPCFFLSWSCGNFLVGIKSSSIYTLQLTNNPRPKRNNTQTTKVELSSQRPATSHFQHHCWNHNCVCPTSEPLPQQPPEP